MNNQSLKDHILELNSKETNVSRALLVDARKTMLFSREKHAGQKRKYSGDPYSDHTDRVACAVSIHEFGSIALVNAGYCHDTIEDCDCAFDDLVKVIGVAATKIVLEVTNPKEGKEGLSRAERKTMDREHLAHASHGARIIKLCDRLDNLSEIPEDSDFAGKYARESLLLLEVIGNTDGELEDKIRDRCEYLIERTSHSFTQK